MKRGIFTLLTLLGFLLPTSLFAISFSTKKFENPPLKFRPSPIHHHGFIRNINPKSPPSAKDPYWLKCAEYMDLLRIGGIVIDVGAHTPPKTINGEKLINYDFLKNKERWERFTLLLNSLPKKSLVWIYDELGYPSASAAGLVLKDNPEFAAKVLQCKIVKSSDSPNYSYKVSDGAVPYFAILVSENKGLFDIESAVKISADELQKPIATQKGKDLCVFEFAYSQTWRDHSVPRRIPNIMDSKAMDKFIEVAYKPYAENLGKLLDKKIYAFFTDEPQLACCPTWMKDAKQLPAVQWTEELIIAFKELNNYEIEKAIPYLFLNAGAMTSKYRYDFYNVYTQLIAKNYFKKIGDWCRANGTKFSGHLLLEESLLFHIMYSGSVMRNLKYMDIPGVDCLFTKPPYRSLGIEWNRFSPMGKEDYTCKLASSVSNINGLDGTFSESFALVKEKQTKLVDIKSLAVWEAYQGINHFTTYKAHHFISPEEFALFSDFVGRLCYVQSLGKPTAKIAVLIPEASVWANYNPPANSKIKNFFAVNNKIGLIDSDFRTVCETLASACVQFEIVDMDSIEAAEISEGKIKIGKMEFSELILPSCEFITSKASTKLEDFISKGGTCYYTGLLPYADEINGVSKKSNLQLRDKLKKFVKPSCDSEISFDGGGIARMQLRKGNSAYMALIANPTMQISRGILKSKTEKIFELYSATTGNNIGRVKGNSVDVEIPPADAVIVIIKEILKEE